MTPTLWSTHAGGTLHQRIDGEILGYVHTPGGTWVRIRVCGRVERHLTSHLRVEGKP